MKNSMNRSFATLAGLVITALTVGCHHTPPRLHGEEFSIDGAPTATGQIAAAQCAAGAKEDGILYDCNFHGLALNSLGQGKLDLMVKGTPAGDPVLVYLDMSHDLVAARQAAVMAYLKNAGIKQTGIVVAEGTNPNSTTPTAYNISGVYKIDNNQSTGQAAVDTTAGGGAGLAGGH